MKDGGADINKVDAAADFLKSGSAGGYTAFRCSRTADAT
jgi:hypothetical protein